MKQTLEFWFLCR